jgi:prepilin-type N-terminal cleavage/methylation domain-containing protein
MRIMSRGRRALTLIELLVVIAIIAILIALLVPAVEKVRYMAARTQTTNNLKQCALASHGYHDVWKCLPFNGVASATNTDFTSGSWGYQILPFIDQQPLFDSQPANSAMAEPVPPYLCAIRGRPGYFTGSTAASVTVTVTYTPMTSGPPFSPTGPPVITTYTANPSVTVTCGPQSQTADIVVSGPVTVSTYQLAAGSATPFDVASWSGGPGEVGGGGGGGGTTTFWIITSVGAASGNPGPATDFGFNVFLNDPNGGINSPNVRRQLDTISDGTSNTILLGHAYVQTSVYSSTTAVPPSLQPIFIGGSLATGRNTLGQSAIDWLQDGAAVTSNQWGSPMYEGGLMAMCDGAVRIFLYATPLTDFLLPDDGNPVELP